MKNRLLNQSVVLVTVVGLAGCNTVGQRPVYSGPTGSYEAGNTQQMVAPAANNTPSYPQYQENAAMPAGNNVMLEKLAADMNTLYQRMQRAERAMIRLDRRMQLIERNELGRMGANTMMGEDADMQRMSGLSTAVTPTVGQIPPAANAYPAGMMPVTASLQPAPQQAYGAQMASLANGGSRLPSLADEEPVNKAEPGMAVWTVRYVDGKIWPDRNQLPASRSVVSALKSDKPVALFARGAQPSSKEFRERVRALSRYLSKVAESNNVAISAMPAQHLDADTIEIFATR